MSNIICIFAGFIFGVILYSLVFILELSNKDDLIEDYKKGIKEHNYRELRLIFIIQSTKDYVKQQLNILKEHEADLQTTEDKTIATVRYIAFKDIEKTINQLEKNSENLIKK